jgi:hypothetical protein
MMKVVSPLDLLDGKDEAEQPRQEHSAPRRPHPSDHIAGSPVGSTNTILHLRRQQADESSIRNSSPRRHSAPARDLWSFVQRAGAPSGDDRAEVDSLLLKQPQ